MTQKQAAGLNQTNSVLNHQEKVVGCNEATLVKEDNELEKLIVNNAFAHCEIYLQGAHVTEFTPKNKPILESQQSLLWLSDDAKFVAGKAIRGGIPICWPWFGPSPFGEGSVAHGFVRNRAWQLESVDTDDNNQTQVRLQIKSDSQTLALWPFEFLLECKLTIGSALTITLTTHNLDSKPMSISEAIHSYFAVSDIQTVSIANLQGNHYVDKLANNKSLVQEGLVIINQATDRIYTHSADEQIIVDNLAKRSIKVAKQGANDTVIWNPWADIAKGMADFNDLGYQHMVCVEAVNSQINPVMIEPGQSHTLSQTISLMD